MYITNDQESRISELNKSSLDHYVALTWVAMEILRTKFRKILYEPDSPH